MPPTAQIGGFLVNAPARHPYVDRPLIDVRVTTFLAPCEMAGAQLGVLLNQMLPSLVGIQTFENHPGFVVVNRISKPIPNLRIGRDQSRGKSVLKPRPEIKITTRVNIGGQLQ